MFPARSLRELTVSELSAAFGDLRYGHATGPEKVKITVALAVASAVILIVVRI